MFQINKAIRVEDIEFYQPRGLGGRWVFAGSRNASGYLTREDAEVEARLQISNEYVGFLNSARPLPKAHRASVKALMPLMDRR